MVVFKENCTVYIFKQAQYLKVICVCLKNIKKNFNSQICVCSVCRLVSPSYVELKMGSRIHFFFKHGTYVRNFSL